MPAFPAAPACGAPGTAIQPRSVAGGAFHPRAHRSYVEAAAHPGAVPYVRRHTRQTLAAWRLGHVAADVELVVSELVTNAVRATLAMQAAAPVALYLALEHGRLYALAWDCCPDLPVLRAPAGDAESGRGLQMVQALSAEWGAAAEPGGKVVFAIFDLAGQSHE
jgi:anti-sigma regulatory factor (Ser/Thr protein kinase)